MSFVPRQTDRYCSVLTSRDFVQACWAAHPRSGPELVTDEATLPSVPDLISPPASPLPLADARVALPANPSSFLGEFLVSMAPGNEKEKHLTRCFK